MCLKSSDFKPNCIFLKCFLESVYYQSLSKYTLQSLLMLKSDLFNTFHCNSSNGFGKTG